MNGFLTKPLTVTALIDVLKPLCERDGSEAVDSSLQRGAAPNTLRFDSAVLLTRLNGDRVLYRKVLRKFMDDAPTQLAVIDNALQEDDTVEAARQAHKFKGALLSIGADTAAACAARLEDAARGNNVYECRSAVAELKQVVTCINEAV